jgi:hypothetical protein
MSEQARRMIQRGDGVYQMSRSEAGEAYRAAKKLKKYEISYWNRNRKNQTQTSDIKGLRRE